MSETVILEMKNVNKSFGANHVVHDLNMKIYEGEFLTILGSSGCGKTTILRMIGGFEFPTTGEVLFDGEDLGNKEPNARNINTVFQSYALFPHMNVYNNIAYGLKIKKMDKETIHKKVMNMLEMVQLSGFERRKISQLSGGQKQRIAISRALVNEPKILLLDEPLGALDLQLRKQMQIELKRLQRKLGITFVFVTHDQEEALLMSDRIAIMNGGYLEQIGTPKEIYSSPKTKFVANFIGESNTFEGVIDNINKDSAEIKLENGVAKVKNIGLRQDEIICTSIRPEKTKWSKEKVDGFSIKGKVKDINYLGTTYKCNVILPNGFEVKINNPNEEMVPHVNDDVYIYWNIDDAVVIKSKNDDVFNVIDKMDLTTEKEVRIHE